MGPLKNAVKMRPKKNRSNSIESGPLAFLTYHEVYAAPRPSIEALNSKLSAVHPAVMLQCCARIGAVLQAASLSGHEIEVQQQLVRGFFPFEMHAGILGFNRVVFHRAQILFVISAVLQGYPGSLAGTVTPDQGSLGEIFLLASDFLYVEVESSGHPAIRNFLRFAPAFEASGMTSPWRKLFRMYVMFTKCMPELLAAGQGRDWEQVFVATVGLTLRKYIALLFAALSKQLQETRDYNPSHVPDVTLSQNWFSATCLTSHDVQSFLDDVSAPPEQLSGSIPIDRKPYDFSVIKDKPYASLGTYCVPLDMTYSVEKAQASFYWRTFKSCQDDSERGEFQSFWGRLFERYCGWLLKCAFGNGKKNLFIESPRYLTDPNNEICDGFVVCDKSLVMLEFKGNVLRADGKYGSSPDLMAKEIEAKFVNKGVSQLARGVRDVAESLQFLKPISSVVLKNISEIIPVLIVQDDAGAAIGLNAYLNDRFQELIGPHRFPVRVAPLILASIDEMEKVSSYLRAVRLSDLFNKRVRLDRNLMRPFSMVIADFLLRQKGKSVSIDGQVLDGLTKDTEEIVFGIKADIVG
jgi:hypothetical protein